MRPLSNVPKTCALGTQAWLEVWLGLCIVDWILPALDMAQKGNNVYQGELHSERDQANRSPQGPPRSTLHKHSRVACLLSV